MSVVHKFELKDGKFFLDGMRIKGYHLSAKENDSLSELSLKIDVRTLGNDGIPEFDNSLDKTGKIWKVGDNNDMQGLPALQAVSGAKRNLQRLYRKGQEIWTNRLA